MKANKVNSRIIHIAAILLSLVLIVYTMVRAYAILLPIAWAVFIALMILPAIRWLEAKKVPRAIAIVIALVLVTIILSAVIYALSLQVAGLLADAPTVTDKLDGWLTGLQVFLNKNFGVSPEMFSQQLFTSLSGMLQAGLRQLRNSLVSVFHTLTLISLIPLYVFFLLYYRNSFYEGTLRSFKNHQQQASPLIIQLSKVVQQYLNGLIIVTFIIGVLFYIVLILLGIKFAFFFAVLLAIFNLIPYIGVIVSSVIVILYAFATTNSLIYPFAVLVLLWLIQLLENYLITPYVIGSRIKVNPMATLIAIFAGAKIWGVSGMILFIPMVGALKVIADEFEPLNPLAIFLGTSREYKKDSD
ncbi:MAG TPA: AI-2E family transporter [Balneolaceae bacterium]|nr:AI-2E family transporter [Balneolaceae bacterium]